MTDFLAQGKQKAQAGDYEGALDAFMLALENDKENPDIHFFLGACYSSMEEFRYAKYHYEIAHRLNPDHERTKMVWEGVKDVIPERPPERKLLRGAAARTRKEQQKEKEPAGIPTVNLEEPASPPGENHPEQHPFEANDEPRIKITDAKWEKAFPGQTVEVKEDRPFIGGGLILWLIVIAATVAGVYYFVEPYLSP